MGVTADAGFSQENTFNQVRLSKRVQLNLERLSLCLKVRGGCVDDYSVDIRALFDRYETNFE